MPVLFRMWQGESRIAIVAWADGWHAIYIGNQRWGVRDADGHWQWTVDFARDACYHARDIELRDCVDADAARIAAA